MKSVAPFSLEPTGFASNAIPGARANDQLSMVRIAGRHTNGSVFARLGRLGRRIRHGVLTANIARDAGADGRYLIQLGGKEGQTAGRARQFSKYTGVAVVIV